LLLLASAPALADVINGTSGADVLDGTSDPDTFHAYAGSDVMKGFATATVSTPGKGTTSYAARKG
jgi:hypothetical protein